MKIFNSIGHFFAWLAQSLLPTVAADVKAVEAAVSSPLAAAIASLDPAIGQKVVNAVLAIGGDVLNLAINAEGAIVNDGMNITFDQNTIAAIKAILPDLKKAFSGQTVPVAVPPASQPIVAGAAKS